MSAAPGRIKRPVAPASAMDWLTSMFIFDVLNRVSCSGDSMLYMEESSVNESIQAVMLLVQLLWIIVLSSSSSSSSYKLL